MTPDQKMNLILDTLYQIQSRMDTFDDRFNGVNGRFNTIDARLQNIESKLAGLAGDIKLIKKCVSHENADWTPHSATT